MKFVMSEESEFVKFFESPRKPLPGNILFEALQPPKEIILAANPRVTVDVIAGILEAAKDSGEIVILELALSEMSLKRGYTGLTPKTFAERVRKAAEMVGWYGYVLHADHMTVKKGTDEELENVRKELDARIEAGFTSFAIDASFLFDRKATTVPEQLKEIIRVGVDLFSFIDEKMKGKPYGREGEVGEIGIAEFTTVEEAVYYVEQMKAHGIELDCLAIANGSKHGVSVDEEGKIIPQLGINIKRTVEIADALKNRGFRTGIAQHGITGTPIELIATKFPKGKIVKGNVGTLWMLLVWDVLKVFQPDLYQQIYKWTIENYRKEGVSEAETFAKSSKYAIKEFFNELEKLDEDTRKAIRAKAYAEALMLFKAFGMKQTAKRVYEYLVKNDIKY